MLIATKVFEFEAAHCLPKYNGLCKKLHGHRWKLEVSVKTIADKLDEQDMIMDFSELKKIVMDWVINKLDHSYINEVLDLRSEEQPTAEVMVKSIADHIQPVLPEGIKLYRLKLWETSTSYIEWGPL